MPNYQLDELWAGRIRTMWYWMRTLRVLGANRFTNNESSCTIDVTPPDGIEAVVGSKPVIATITGTSSSGANWKQIIPQVGSNAAQLAPGGLSDDTTGLAIEISGASLRAGSGTNGQHVTLFKGFDSGGNQCYFCQTSSAAGFPARLTSGGSRYGFIEVNPDGSSVTSPRQGNGVGTNSGAVPLNGATGYATGTSSGQIVTLFPKSDGSGDYYFGEAIRLSSGSNSAGSSSFNAGMGIGTTAGVDSFLTIDARSGDGIGQINYIAPTGDGKVMTSLDGKWIASAPFFAT